MAGRGNADRPPFVALSDTVLACPKIRKAPVLQNKARTKDEIAALFDGMEPIPPGVTMVNQWHPDETASRIPDEHVSIAGGIARKL
ncbi:SAM-dependent methyltransferase [Actinomadura adrarensis]|uniref:SAM-dependent methyltransferase n=1 Tax=Actinomadura adrarensis TaxID=1819600 RepID=A0ABW3CG17_9ACTN